LPSDSIREIVRKDGFITDYLKYTEPFEYPERFAVFSLLVMASIAVNKRILINPGSKPQTFTNLYVVLYGPSGSRKSEALLDALEVLSEACPNAPVLPMNFTMEALRGRLAKDSDDTGKAPGLILAEELSTLLGGRDYLLNNSLFLSKVWDGRRAETFLTIAHQEQIIRESYVVLGGCSTPEAFGDLDPKGLSTGFLRRLLFVAAYGPKCESPLPQVNSTFFNTCIVPRFKDRLGPAAFKDTTMQLSDDARIANCDWYSDYLKAMRLKHVGPRESHFVNTMQVHAFKIAALVHLLEHEDPKELSANSLNTGFRLLDLLIPGILEAYSSLVPTAFAKMRALAIRVMGVASKNMTPKMLDIAIWKEAGVRPEEAAAVRLSLVSDNTLHTLKNGAIIRMTND